MPRRTMQNLPIRKIPVNVNAPKIPETYEQRRHGIYHLNDSAKISTTEAIICGSLLILGAEFLYVMSLQKNQASSNSVDDSVVSQIPAYAKMPVVNYTPSEKTVQVTCDSGFYANETSINGEKVHVVGYNRTFVKNFCAPGKQDGVVYN